MRIASIGAGKMATAILGGLIESGTAAAADLTASDLDPAALDRLRAATGIEPTTPNATAARAADVILLCVKPQDAMGALAEIAPHLEGRLVVSIAAGLTLAAIERVCPAGTRVARVMPNTPALVRQGASVFALGRHATEDDAATVERIFSSVGLAFRVAESSLDAVTGLSGSGPAYLFLVIEALADGGVLAGLPRPLALTLAAQTARGAAELALRSGKHPGQLKDDVASPGGTTIAGLAALESDGIRAAFIRAVAAATARARELSRED